MWQKPECEFHHKLIRIAKRMCAKLLEPKIELRRRLHHPTPVVRKWLRVVLLGHTGITDCRAAVESLELSDII
jgi:hypothetical protein